MDDDQPLVLVHPEGLNPDIKALATNLGIEVVASSIVPKGKALMYYPNNAKRIQRDAARRNLLLRLTRGDVS